VLKELFEDPKLPDRIRKQKGLVYSAFYSMLAGGAFSLGRPAATAKWALKAVLSDPRRLSYMAGMPLRRIRRTESKQVEPIEFRSAVERFRDGVATRNNAER
jgi:hypothetical protein